MSIWEGYEGAEVYLVVQADENVSQNVFLWYSFESVKLQNGSRTFDNYIQPKGSDQPIKASEFNSNIVDEYSRFKNISYDSVKIIDIIEERNLDGVLKSLKIVVIGHEKTPSTESDVEKSSKSSVSSVEKSSKSSVSSVEKTAHTHSYSWNVVTEATESGDGLELYQCSCGDVQARSVIPASQVYVNKFRDFIQNAPTNGTVTYDSKMNHTFSDYIIKRLAERTDVTTVIDFKWQNADYTMTIPAGVDYAPFFADTENFYGYFCFAQMTGASIVAK